MLYISVLKALCFTYLDNHEDEDCRSGLALLEQQWDEKWPGDVRRRFLDSLEHHCRYHWIAECSLETLRASFQAWFRSWSRTDGCPRLPLTRQKVYNGKISVGAYVEEAARPHLQWRNGKGTARCFLALLPITS